VPVVGPAELVEKTWVLLIGWARVADVTGKLDDNDVVVNGTADVAASVPDPAMTLTPL
jgi:hypothetical protein